MQTCDNRSVGVLITADDDRTLLITRARPPAGRAPVAGHVDEHGDPRQAAVAEEREEAGLQVVQLELVAEGLVDNRCRRPLAPGAVAGHYWWIYRAGVLGHPAAQFSPEETRGGGWYAPERLQQLAERTVARCSGQLSADEFAADPGLEPVWVLWLSRLGLVRVGDRDLEQVAAVYTQDEQI